MLHGSTLAFTVSVVDINAQAQIVASTNWKFFEAYLAAALIFWGLTFLIERATALIEKRINLYNRGSRMIKLSQLSKSFGRHQVLNHIDLEVSKGRWSSFSVPAAPAKQPCCAA